MAEKKEDLQAEADELAADKNSEQVVLQLKINWAGYEKSGFITSKELGMMRDYDKSDRPEQEDLLAEQGPAYAAFFVKALDTIREKEAVQYLLTLVDQLLRNDPSRAAYFHTAQNPYSPFYRILSREENEYTLTKACHILSLLLCSNPQDKCPELSQFVGWLTNRVGTTKGRELVHTMSALKDILKRQESHAMFYKYGGLSRLSNMLKKETQNTQLLYLVGFSVWLLAYNADMMGHLSKFEIVRKLIEIVKVVMREKVVRICFCTLTILLDKEKFNEEMIAHGLLKVLDTLLARKWKDDDLVKEMQRIQSRLLVAIEDLSSYDIYENEVKSGALEWTPVHSERFWRENALKFEDNNFILIKRLIDLLSSDSERTLEVACYDLGEFARFHPEGRLIIQKNGGKHKLMAQMSSPSPKVAKEALLSVQKLLVGNWEFLNKGAEKS